ncbi:MAG: PucR family transcriptional regulator ligand-binding domain-containing protein, partial [Vulcanimicrobiaceae bacterium]
MKLADALRLPSLRAVTVVAGTAALEREIRWVHVVDIPEPAPWVRAGQLLLTTGYAWTADSRSMHRQIPKLAELGLTALGLAVPRYVPRFSATARREGDRVGLALLEIPWEIPFTQITEEVHRTILGEQAIAIERAEEIHRELTRVATEAAGLHDVAVTLGRLLNRSVAFEHANGTLLAHHSVAAVDAVRRQSIERAATPKRVQRALERDGYIEAIRRTSSSVEIPAIPALGMAARLAAPIRLGGEFVGCVWIIQGDRPIGDLDRRAAEHAALIAALQIARLRELEAIEHR